MNFHVMLHVERVLWGLRGSTFRVGLQCLFSVFVDVILELASKAVNRENVF